jgi:macrodomain Ter protein organizer (MatP/YcbG family)
MMRKISLDLEESKYLNLKHKAIDESKTLSDLIRTAIEKSYGDSIER